ncbi:MAG: hypothetical protein ABEL76_03075 [Bradymonadaceae bacterium]
MATGRRKLDTIRGDCYEDRRSFSGRNRAVVDRAPVLAPVALQPAVRARLALGTSTADGGRTHRAHRTVPIREFP